MKKHLDLFIALVVFAIAGSATLAVYQRIKQIQEPALKLMSAIPQGTRFYHILQNKKCLASFQVQANHESIYSILTKGEVRLTLKGQTINVSISSSSFFNPLGQLIKSNAELKAPNISLRVNAENINPIKTIIRGQVGKKTYNQKLSLPGPVLIEKAFRGSTFKLSYPHLKQLNNSHLLKMAGSLSKNHQLAVIPSLSESEYCPKEKRASLDVGPLLKEIQALQPLMRGIVGL